MPQFRPLSETKFINDANLLAYYPLNGNSNDAKNSNNGTDNNISYVTGQYGQAASFNGTSSKIILPNGVRTGGNFTFSCVFNSGNLSGDHHFYSDWSASQKNFIISLSGTALLFIGGNGSSSQGATLTGETLSTGTNYTLTVVRNGTTNKVYLNGKEVLSQTIAYSGGTTTNNLYLGVFPDLSGGWFSGWMDDVAILSRALSQQEVMDLYQGKTLGEYIPNANTKGYWRLNGNSMDFSGNNNNGTDTNISYVPGRFGQCASFNGTSSKITNGTNSSLAFTGDFTISFWLYRTAVNKEVTLICRGENNGATNNNYEIRSPLLGGGYGLCLAGVGGARIDTTSLSFSANIWYNVVCAKTGSNASPTIKFYVNNVNQPVTGSNSINTSGTQTLSIGVRNDGFGYLNGSIDEVIIENIAWTPQQVAKYYSQSKGRFGIL